MEVQKSTADKKWEEHRVQITELEAQNSSLEFLLKATNERKIDIAPLREHALAEESFWIKQVEDRLQEMSTVATTFKEKTQEIVDTLQGQLTLLETNTERPENIPKKCLKKLQIK